MKICVLGSGSGGNATLVESGGVRILVDAGFSGVELERRLARIGVAPESLAGLVLTHDHRDHSMGVGIFARRHELPIYITEATRDACRSLLRGVEELIHFRPGRSFHIRRRRGDGGNLRNGRRAGDASGRAAEGEVGGGPGRGVGRVHGRGHAPSRGNGDTPADAAPGKRGPSGHARGSGAGAVGENGAGGVDGSRAGSVDGNGVGVTARHPAASAGPFADAHPGGHGIVDPLGRQEADGLRIDPFVTVHDAADPTAVIVACATKGTRVGIATDLGRSTAGIRHALSNCDFLILEANHCKLMLGASRYPASVKQRIASSHGHLSNEAAAQLALELLHPRLAGVLLAHLSEECNRPELARKVVGDALKRAGYRGFLDVAPQDRPTSIIDIEALRARSGPEQLTLL